MNTVLKCTTRWFLTGLFFLITMVGQAQEMRIEPPNWWTGFKNTAVQLLVHYPDIGGYEVQMDFPGVELRAQHQAHSPNYLFLDLLVTPAAQPGEITLSFRKAGQDPIRKSFVLQGRKRQALTYEGFKPNDVIYLITPDRFANGDPTNDRIPGMQETKVNRKEPFGRHGGDIQGMIDHLDYIHAMGFTALWPSPLLENNMPEQSYHGYAITDYYRVDPRFGTLEKYRELAEKSRELGIKLIMDQVANHCGRQHWWMNDLPFNDWIHHQAAIERGEKATITNHRRTTNQDPYASQADAASMEQGWFVSAMPDLNQGNPFLAKYLIQNSIWWIETLGLGGIRQDTYPYADKDFMARWAGRIMQEYPNFSIVGEEWSYNPLLVAYWQQGANNPDGYESNLSSTMDFPIQGKLISALNEEEDWDTGLITLYEALANDFHYPDPSMMMVFGDNHDMDRLYTQLGEDPVRTRMALAYLLTIPRIPQVYYGTEILMENSAYPDHHGHIRTDFPGGWAGDNVNAFTGKGLKKPQQAMQKWLKKLLQFRKENKAIHRGTTVHFAPEDGVYVLARQQGEKQVVLVLNKNESPVVLSTKRFMELGMEGKEVQELFSEKTIPWQGEIQLDTKGAYLFYR